MRIEVTDAFREVILHHWGEPEFVLGAALEEFKYQIIHTGLAGEACSDVSRDEHAEHAGQIGLRIGQSKTANEFLAWFGKIIVAC